MHPTPYDAETNRPADENPYNLAGSPSHQPRRMGKSIARLFPGVGTLQENPLWTVWIIALLLVLAGFRAILSQAMLVLGLAVPAKQFYPLLESWSLIDWLLPIVFGGLLVAAALQLVSRSASAVNLLSAYLAIGAIALIRVSISPPWFHLFGWDGVRQEFTHLIVVGFAWKYASRLRSRRYLR